MDVVSLYSTWPDLRSAEAAAEALVERRLAACANLVPGVRSFYRWQGEMQRDEEVAMFAKTRAALAEQARDLLVDLHPYDTPCVLTLPLDAAKSHAAFVAWIAAETG